MLQRARCPAPDHGAWFIPAALIQARVARARDRSTVLRRRRMRMLGVAVHRSSRTRDAGAVEGHSTRAWRCSRLVRMRHRPLALHGSALSPSVWRATRHLEMWSMRDVVGCTAAAYGRSGMADGTHRPAVSWPERLTPPDQAQHIEGGALIAAPAVAVHRRAQGGAVGRSGCCRRQPRTRARQDPASASHPCGAQPG
jgi:hypothetical protein